jgi:hypothetical protein
MVPSYRTERALLKFRLPVAQQKASAQAEAF